MFEQVKQKLMNDYNSEMSKYESLKEQMSTLEEQFKNDDSEENYQNDLKALNKKFGMFKKGTKEYKEQLKTLQLEYNEKLKQFEADYNNYVNLKNEAAKINVYVIQKKMEQLTNAASLEDLHMTEEDAIRVIEGDAE